LGIFLVLLAPSAITKAGNNDRIDIDTVRQELLRLRAEREQKRRNPPPETPPGRSDRFPVSGAATLETNYRFSPGKRDIDTSLFVRVDAGDDTRDRVTGGFSGRLSWDLDGLASHNRISAADADFVDSNDIDHKRMVERIYTAFVDLNRLDPLTKVRLGRQFHESYTGAHFDGIQVFADPGEDTSLSIYGGVPVHYYDAAFTDDRLVGGTIRNRTLDKLTATLDLQQVRDSNRYYGTRDDYLAVLGLTYSILDNLRASIVESVVSGQQRDLQGTMHYWNIENNLNMTLHYGWMPERLDSLADEYTPFADIMSGLEPYQLFSINAVKGIGDHFEMGAEVMLHELVHTTDESAFNKEYTRNQISFNLIDLPVDDLTTGVHWEYWDTSDDSEYSVGGDVRHRLARHHVMEAGTYYSKFKYRQFSLVDTLDVQTYYVRWRWALGLGRAFYIKAEVEDADDATYNTISATFMYRF